MKTILFLHREQLTDLFVPVSKQIGTRMNILHVAYSDKEEAMLEDAGIRTDYNYEKLLAGHLQQIRSVDRTLLEEIDTLFVENSDRRFNLNGSLQSDRGMSVLSYEESLLLAQAHYKVWKEIFDKWHVDLLIHEPCSLFFNHLAAILCKAQQGIYLTQSATYGKTEELNYINLIHDDYTCPEVEQNELFYLKHSEKMDRESCDAFIRKFRSSYEVFLSNIQPKTNRSLLWLRSRKRQWMRFLKRNKYDRMLQNVDYWLNLKDSMGDRLRNLRDYKKKGIRFEEPVEGEKYYYYSFHQEPEAVVLYLGDGIYANQVKLIENIAASLPVGCYLYVKDHPHEFAYRCADDYLRLGKVPNIRLIRSAIPGKQLIKNAVGVFTINGTAGFEGVMLRKQVYCFGKSYYSDYEGVNYIHNIRDLRKIVYENQEKIYEDDDRFYAFVNGYLDSLHVGMIDFFMGRAKTYGIDLDLNARRIADDLVRFSEKYQP